MYLDYLSCFAVFLRGDTLENWYMPNIYICSKLRIFPYSKVRHASTTFKLKIRQSTIEFGVCFVLFFFIWLSQTISVINRNDMRYFLHASNSGGVCLRVHLRLRTSNEDCHWVTKGKKCFNCLNETVQINDIKTKNFSFHPLACLPLI